MEVTVTLLLLWLAGYYLVVSYRAQLIMDRMLPLLRAWGKAIGIGDLAECRRCRLAIADICREHDHFVRRWGFGLLRQLQRPGSRWNDLERDT